MNKIRLTITRCFVFGLIFSTGIASSFGQSDKIRFANDKPVTAKIQSMDGGRIVANVRGKKTTYPRWQFDYVEFAGQPTPLARIQRLIGQKQYIEAFKAVGKAKWGSPKINSRLEVLYTIAKVQSELTLAGNNLTDSATALKSIDTFLKQAKGAHYRVSDANFLKARLQMGQGQIDSAVETLKQYEKEAKGEIAFDIKLKHGSLLLIDQKFDDAAPIIQSAIEQTKRTGADLTIAKLALAASKSASAGIKASENEIRKLLENSNPEDHRVNGFAYNFLGTAFLKAGKTKEAESAFLHTDLLFYNNAEAHPEALYRLAMIWRNTGKKKRYSEAVQKLKQRYGGTYWANRLGG